MVIYIEVRYAERRLLVEKHPPLAHRLVDPLVPEPRL